ncbi:hypothetical protein GCM10010329_67780 [Streptomyces spiroverticillatus]|uniref:Uncharacterized protein n=1 Tax=Streptomyces finlayi TaxID=67296 RepID=A0A918X561_9ACTN|nr:hypothetical protein [Streptomyces finlayi]GHA35078.1 hypothetical protein GCM10010329_67780 [Streptomyces spiroverticillatus]GHD13089.1 hypothetical protein GCM10010334_70890 [Streptomyces finlayi]
MTAQPEHHHRPVPAPPMTTVRELRLALRTYGTSAEVDEFEERLADADLDDLTQARRLVQRYRHRVLLRCDPEGAAALARTDDDVAAELRRRLDAKAGGR